MKTQGTATIQHTQPPELLALAKTVELWVSKGILKAVAPYENNEAGLLQMARAAIAKAEGKA